MVAVPKRGVAAGGVIVEMSGGVTRAGAGIVGDEPCVVAGRQLLRCFGVELGERQRRDLPRTELRQRGGKEVVHRIGPR